MTTIEYRFNRCPICHIDIRDRAEGEGCKGCLATEDEMQESMRTPEDIPIKKILLCNACGSEGAKYMRGSLMVCEACR